MSNMEKGAPKSGVKHKYGRIDTDYGARMFMTPAEEDGPIYMLNYMRYKEVAEYTDGDGKAISGKEADDLYNPTEVLHKFGADPVFFGDVIEQIGAQLPAWDRIGTVCYPTRKSFIEMESRKDFQEKHVHKAAGMAETFITCGLPMTDVSTGAASAKLQGTKPFVSVSAWRALETSSVDELKAALLAGVAHIEAVGGRVGAWFDVEGTIIGDGRRYDINCYNQYAEPADFHAALKAMQSDPACAMLFDDAKSDGYTVLVKPGIDKISPRP